MCVKVIKSQCTSCKKVDTNDRVCIFVFSSHLGCKFKHFTLSHSQCIAEILTWTLVPATQSIPFRALSKSEHEGRPFIFYLIAECKSLNKSTSAENFPPWWSKFSKFTPRKRKFENYMRIENPRLVE
jgi:hypothetical protein